MKDQFTSQWYDEYYKANPQNFSPWYRSVLEWLHANRPGGRLFEVGCGNGKLLEQLTETNLYAAEDLYGIEQSAVAIDALIARFPHVSVANAQERLPFDDASFEVVVMTEVIEHLLYPWQTIAEIRRVLKPGGVLLLSFPNFLNIPWLAIRVLGELLERTSWTVLQPIDRMYIYPRMKKHLQECGFSVEATIGKVFWPPVLYKYEPRAFTATLNRLGLGGLALHPLLVCRKPKTA